MKTETVIKVLNRYIKGLDGMREQALHENEPKDANHYEFDLMALEQARDLIIDNLRKE